VYIIIILGLLFLGGFFISSGITKRKNNRVVLGALIILLMTFFFWFMGFWGEMLWFDVLGYGTRFWKVIITKTGTLFLGAVFGLLSVYLLAFPLFRENKRSGLISIIIGALLGGLWGLSQWDTILMYINRVSVDIADPILGKDAGFYLFTLPLLDSIYFLLLILGLVAFIFSLFSLFTRLEVEDGDVRFEPRHLPMSGALSKYRAIYIPAGVLLLILACGKYLDRFHIMYSSLGAVYGAGWTDVNVKLPAYTFVTFLTALLGVILLIPPLRSKAFTLFHRAQLHERIKPLGLLAVAAVLTFGSWFILLTALPALFQWLRVEPNEITLERPFIAHNIDFTRRGFGLERIEEREFPVSGLFTREMVEKNQNLFSNIRLWDWRALDAVYKQFQEIRLYYEFKDVDIDRYAIGDNYRQVMVSAREMEQSNLPQQSQTFVNKRFKYTHGYGITLTTVREFTPEGLPNLLIKDIPPKSAYPTLEVKRPEIYYGELTYSHVIVNSKEEELDYPSGEKNIYAQYTGNGGVQLSNLWRKFLYGWKFDGTRFFVSDYPRSESRVMFHRQVEDRIKTLAPFVYFDDDPYIVLIKGGLYWIIDGYITSKYFPYSEPFSTGSTIQPGKNLRERLLQTQTTRSLQGVNYIRNSVKAVVNAYDGSVDFYIFEPEDPIIKVWSKIFPGLFKRRQEMPEDLFAHVRYPSDMLLVQGLIYAKYHMTDPAVFYNQEDLWIRATEKYRNRVQPVDPYYIMWELPGSDKAQFINILPFTPKNRQVLIGWIAGMCDQENYGRFLAYKFPKEKRVLGTQQVETKIDQDRFLSGQLTLWDQRGSNVIRGNVLAIPIENTLLYVEPIYLQAETAAYPELRLVVVMHNDNLSYGETFDEALQGLFTPGKIEIGEKETVQEKATTDSLIMKASESFNNYLNHLGKRKFEEASNSLEELRETLEKLTGRIDPVHKD
jgi:uncharacterized membrane protein (UPF0182 family)